MNQPTKTNKYAIAAAISGILSVALYVLVIILGTMFPPPEGHHSPLMGATGPIILIFVLSSFLVMAPLGVVLGVIGLRSIGKSDVPQKGRKLAWAGIATGGGYILASVVFHYIWKLINAS